MSRAPQVAKADSAEGKTASGRSRSSLAPLARTKHISPPVPAPEGHKGCSCGGGCPACSGALAKAGVQPKLAIDPPHSAAEAEADRTADQVMRGGDARAPIATPPGGALQRAPAANGAPPSVKPAAPGPLGRQIDSMGRGAPLPAAERSFFEGRMGMDFSDVRIHTGAAPAQISDRIGARAFTRGNDIAFSRGEYQPGTSAGRRLMAHELTHVAQQRHSGARVQRAMKFEFQVKKNRIHAWNGADTESKTLVRKYGPEDYLQKSATGATMESETGGQMEFETGWERDFSKMKTQVKDITDWVDAIKKAPKVKAPDTGGTLRDFRIYPFSLADQKDPKKWKSPAKTYFDGSNHVPAYYENNKADATERGDSILQGSSLTTPAQAETAATSGKDSGEFFMVRERDANWNAYIQTSESMELSQYPKLMKQHEYATYYDARAKKGAAKSYKKLPFAGDVGTRASALAATAVQDIKAANPKLSLSANFDGMITLVMHMILRGQFPASSPAYKSAKFTFAVMNRSHMGSVYKHTLTKDEKKAFRYFVRKRKSLVLTPMGLSSKSKFFAFGQGSKNNKGQNPTVSNWLRGIQKNRDLVSSRDKPKGKQLSFAMGRHKVNDEKGMLKDHLRFERRVGPRTGFGSVTAVAADSSQWGTYVKQAFDDAIKLRDQSDPDTGLLP